MAVNYSSILTLEKVGLISAVFFITMAPELIPFLKVMKIISNKPKSFFSTSL
jgi:hypothetical protein